MIAPSEFSFWLVVLQPVGLGLVLGFGALAVWVVGVGWVREAFRG